ncbi:MAG: hypothetical protein AAF558_05915 [Verrucomicrobiota bacterium]
MKSRKITRLGTIGYIVLILLLAVWGALLIVRYVGLPDQIGKRLASELNSRGLTLDFKKLYLDPLGRVVARDVQILHSSPSSENRLDFDRLSFEFNWISWWRGEPFLENASIRGGELFFPISEETGIRLSDLYAEIRIRNDALVIDQLEGRLLNLFVQVQGEVVLEGFKAPPASKPPTAEQIEQQARLWDQIEKAAAEFKGADPISVSLKVQLPLAAPMEGQIDMMIEGQRQLWKGVLFEKIVVEALYEDRVARLHGDVDFLKGHLEFEGRWNPKRPNAELVFFSDVDFSLLAPAMPSPFDEFLGDVVFSELPENQGKIRFNWARDFSFHLITRSTWRSFSVLGVPFDYLYFPLSYDGKRLMVSQLEMRNATGEATFDVFFDGDKTLKGKLASTLVPTSLKKLFGEKAQPFFNSLVFDGAGPQIECKIIGTGFKPEEVRLEGNVGIKNFRYKGVKLNKVDSSFSFENFALHLPDLKVEEGSPQVCVSLLPEYDARSIWHLVTA